MDPTTPAAESPPDQLKQRGRLSQVAGAGVGTFFVGVTQGLELSRPVEHTLTICAPILAIGIAAIGPFVQDVAVNYCRLLNSKWYLRQARLFAQTLKEGSRSRLKADDNIVDMEGLIADSLKHNLVHGTKLEFSRSVADATRALHGEVLAGKPDADPAPDPAQS